MKVDTSTVDHFVHINITSTQGIEYRVRLEVVEEVSIHDHVLQVLIGPDEPPVTFNSYLADWQPYDRLYIANPIDTLWLARS